MFARLWLVALAALILGAAPVQAQETKLDPPDLARYLRWGPLRVRPGFQVSNVGFDNNIFANDLNKVGDYTATLSPKIDGLVLFGSRAFYTFASRFDYTAYLEFYDQNYLDQRHGGRVTVPLGEMGFFAEYVLNRVHERPIDQQDIRPERDEDGLGAGFVFEVGWRTEVEVAVETLSLRYSDPDSPRPSDIKRLDRDETGVRMDASYHLLGRTAVTLETAIEPIDFLNPGAAGENQDSTAWRLLPGVRFGEGGALSGTAKVGWAEVKAIDPQRPDFADVVGQAELAFKPSRRTTLIWELQRIPGFAVTDNATYYVDNRLGMRGIYYFNRILGIESGAYLGRLTFPESRSGFEREDDMLRFELGVRFRLAENTIGRRVEYSLKFITYQRRSNDPFANQSRSTLGFGAVLGF